MGSFWRLEPKASARLRRRSGDVFLNDVLPRVAMRLYDSFIVMARHFSSSGDVENKFRVGNLRVKDHAKDRVEDRNNDQKLIQIVDAALADATRRSGKWLVCRLGCTQCCIGVFAINQLDARRLRLGLAKLALREPERAARIRERALSPLRGWREIFPETRRPESWTRETMRLSAFLNLPTMSPVQFSTLRPGTANFTNHVP